jgi:hypothetical protein
VEETHVREVAEEFLLSRDIDGGVSGDVEVAADNVEEGVLIEEPEVEPAGNDVVAMELGPMVWVDVGIDSNGGKSAPPLGDGTLLVEGVTSSVLGEAIAVDVRTVLTDVFAKTGGESCTAPHIL